MNGESPRPVGKAIPQRIGSRHAGLDELGLESVNSIQGHDLDQTQLGLEPIPLCSWRHGLNQLEGSLEVADGFAVGKLRDTMLARLLPIPDRQLGQACPGVVQGQQLRLALSHLRTQPNNRRGDARMQRAAELPQQCAVARIPQENMPEAVHRLRR
jgi:hypothetical protein